MRKRAALMAVLLAAVSLSAPCIGFEVGVVVGGDFSFVFGSYLASKAAMLAETGSTTPGSLGRSLTMPYPGGSAGIYGEAGLTSWLGLRLEPRLSFMCASRLALTDAGNAFCRYGVSFSSLVVPLLVRGKFRLGPGSLTATAGPFYGVIVGNITVVDRYVSATTTGTLTPATGQVEFLGVSAGAGYSLPVGPGVAALELRANCAITPATGQD
ncbi:MAG: hypothetical protein IMZ69_05355, partial [Spirochaetes bacterium]|nr:hypothetical protein [Spirochaetota bacterium]